MCLYISFYDLFPIFFAALLNLFDALAVQSKFNGNCIVSKRKKRIMKRDLVVV